MAFAFSAGEHLWGSPEGHGGEGGRPGDEVQEELAKRGRRTTAITPGGNGGS